MAQFVAWYTPIQTRRTHKNRGNIIIDDADYMELHEDVEQDALQNETNTGDGAPSSEVKYHKKNSAYISHDTKEQVCLRHGKSLKGT